MTATQRQRWLSAVWPIVRSHLPSPPASIVEVGCGQYGGFVPALEDDGYGAIGIDPGAPDGPSYRRVEFERSELAAPVDAIVACTSLHHVADPAVVLDKFVRDLAPGGHVVVVEWDWESFDEPTARWCFERLGSGPSTGWLGAQRDRWTASGQPWEQYFGAWVDEEGLHSATTLLRELDRRFHRVACGREPYLFADLPDTTEEEELEAIDTGRIRATRIDYVGVVNP